MRMGKGGVCTSAMKGIAILAAVITAQYLGQRGSQAVRRGGGGGAYVGGRCRIGDLCVGACVSF